MKPLRITGGRVLAGSALLETELLVVDAHIDAIGADRTPRDATEVDARDLLVLPGIVDVHGDAFERQLMPRPGVVFDPAVALVEVDRQLLANGITSACHALTVSWEPGLRGVAAAAGFVDALDARREGLLADHRLQIRWELFALDAVERVAAWLEATPVPALAFNDHLGDIRSQVEYGGGEKLRGWAERAGLSAENYVELAATLERRADEVPGAIESLAARARELGAPLLSHDDADAAARRRYRALGATIAEFPMSAEAAGEARSAGEPIVLGAPNVVRGGSQSGALDARAAIERDLCTVLATDYYYPAPFAAVAALVGGGTLSLERAWPLVSANPAAALGLDDRGRLEPGLRADLLLVEHEGGVPRAVLATVAAGELTWHGAGLRERLDRRFAPVP